MNEKDSGVDLDGAGWIGSFEGSVDGLHVELALSERFPFRVDLIHHRLQVALLDACNTRKRRSLNQFNPIHFNRNVKSELSYYWQSQVKSFNLNLMWFNWLNWIESSQLSPFDVIFVSFYCHFILCQWYLGVILVSF